MMKQTPGNIAAAAIFAGLTFFVVFHHDTPLTLQDDLKIASVREDAFNSQRAMDDISAQLAFGRRSPGTEGHEQTVAYIREQLAKTAAKVETQTWKFKDDSGKEKTLTNIIARFFPSNTKRVLVGTHYDTIVRAYRDKEKPDAVMPGANNGASGPAVLLETARALSVLPMPPVGVDLVFFDAEEGANAMGGGEKHWRAVGSPYFVEHIKDFYPDGNPKSMLDFDMVCTKDLVLKPDRSSLRGAQDEMGKFWTIGVKTAPAIFDAEHVQVAISDDHTAFQKINIPAFVLIGWDESEWFNTTQDTLDKCAASSLEATGKTLLKYIYTP